MATRDSTGRQGRKPSQRPRRKPVSPETLERLLHAREPVDIGTSAVDALRQIQDDLGLIRAAARVVARALVKQNYELDDDAAQVLTRYIGEALTDQMVRIGLLIHGGES